MTAAKPFPSAEAAWFWCMRALMNRRNGSMVPTGPCEPDTIVLVLDQLYRRRRIDLVHLRILRIWGERQMAPSLSSTTERANARLWKEAIERLEWPLRVKEIVA